MHGRLRAMWTRFWKVFNAVEDGLADFFHDWRHNHLTAAPVGILLSTLYLWQLADPEQRTIGYAASLVGLGALIYGSIISSLEVVTNMFYAIAKRLEYKDKLRKEGKEEGIKEGIKEGKERVIARLKDLVSPEQMEMLADQLECVDR